MSLTGTENETQLLAIYVANANYDTPRNQTRCENFVGAARALVGLRGTSFSAAGRTFTRETIQTALTRAEDYYIKYFSGRANGRSSFVGTRFADPAGAHA